MLLNNNIKLCDCLIYIECRRQYHVDTFIEAYRFAIHSISRSNEWPKDGDDNILPPQYRRQPGRPRVVRRRTLDEPNKSYKVTRQGYDYASKTCKMVRHNTRTFFWVTSKCIGSSNSWTQYQNIPKEKGTTGFRGKLSSS